MRSSGTKSVRFGEAAGGCAWDTRMILFSGSDLFHCDCVFNSLLIPSSACL
jgi:hypothetical protein